MLPEVPNPTGSNTLVRKGVYLWQIILGLKQCIVRGKEEERKGGRERGREEGGKEERMGRERKREESLMGFHSDQPNTITV